MKVAIVHDFLEYFGGAEKVLKSISEIFPKADLFFLASKKKLVQKYFPEKNIKNSFLQKLPGIFSKFGKFFYLKLFPIAVESFDFRGYDLVISTHTFAKGVIVDEDTIHISYLHSPTRFFWDYTHKTLDERKISGLKRLFVQSIFSDLRVWDQVSSKRPDLIIVNSNLVKERVKKYYGRDSKVIYPPIEIEKFKPRKENSGYFLLISRLTEFKKVDVVIETFNEIGEDLLIIGDGKLRKKLESIAKENVSFVGFVSSEDLSFYVENCRALIQISEEDFGIAPIEAFSAGKPVIAYKKGGILETLKEGINGVFFDEQTKESLKKGLEKFVEFEPRFDYTKIRMTAENFSDAIFRASFKKEVSLLFNWLKKT